MSKLFQNVIARVSDFRQRVTFLCFCFHKVLLSHLSKYITFANFQPDSSEPKHFPEQFKPRISEHQNLPAHAPPQPPGTAARTRNKKAARVKLLRRLSHAYARKD